MNRSKKYLMLALFAVATMVLGTTGFAQGAEGAAAAAAVDLGGLSRAAYFLGLALTGFGAAGGLGRAVSAALESIARQPEAAGDIRNNMILGCALIEALAIYVLISPILALLIK